MAKKKKTVIIDVDDDDDGDYEVGLNLTIHHADDIENSTTHPNVNRRLYGVVGWVTPEGYEFFTQEAEGLPNPVWNLRHPTTADARIVVGCLHLIRKARLAERKYLNSEARNLKVEQYIQQHLRRRPL
ncbi:hypothetical protein L1049_011691 [Liquidambar formosana]|uniref:Uncharacterized protein n=1 Tax=Liquidambar formosana TaxID=63359 RepID=A0AAP0X2G2_LIQFO